MRTAGREPRGQTRPRPLQPQAIFGSAAPNPDERPPRTPGRTGSASRIGHAFYGRHGPPRGTETRPTGLPVRRRLVRLTEFYVRDTCFPGTLARYSPQDRTET